MANAVFYLLALTLLVAAFCAGSASAQFGTVTALGWFTNPAQPSEGWQFVRLCGTDTTGNMLWDCRNLNGICSSNCLQVGANGPACDCQYRSMIPDTSTNPWTERWLSWDGENQFTNNGFPIQLRWGRPLCWDVYRQPPFPWTANPYTLCTDTYDPTPSDPTDPIQHPRRSSGVGYRPPFVPATLATPGERVFFGRVAHFNYRILPESVLFDWDFNLRITLDTTASGGDVQTRTYKYRLSLDETYNVCDQNGVNSGWPSGPGGGTDGCFTASYWTQNPNSDTWPACFVRNPTETPYAFNRLADGTRCCPYVTVFQPCSDRINQLDDIDITQPPYIVDLCQPPQAPCPLEYVVRLNGFSEPGTGGQVVKRYFISQENLRSEAELYGSFEVRCPVELCPDGSVPTVTPFGCQCTCTTTCPNCLQQTPTCGCECPDDFDCGPDGVPTVQGNQCVCQPNPTCAEANQQAVCSATQTVNGCPEADCRCRCTGTAPCANGCPVIDDTVKCSDQVCDCSGTCAPVCDSNQVLNDICQCVCDAAQLQQRCESNTGCTWDGPSCNCTCPGLPECVAKCIGEGECFREDCAADQVNCDTTYFDNSACGNQNLCLQRCIPGKKDCQAAPVDCDSQIDLVALYGAETATCYTLECDPATGECAATFNPGPCYALDLEALYGEQAQCYEALCTGNSCTAEFKDAKPCVPAQSDTVGNEPQCYEYLCDPQLLKCAASPTPGVPCQDGDPCTIYPNTTDPLTGDPSDRCIQGDVTRPQDGKKNVTCVGYLDPCIQDFYEESKNSSKKSKDQTLDEFVASLDGCNTTCLSSPGVTGGYYCINPCIVKKAGRGNAAAIVGPVVGSVAGLVVLALIIALIVVAAITLAGGAAAAPGLAGAPIVAAASDNPLYAGAGNDANPIYS